MYEIHGPIHILQNTTLFYINLFAFDNFIIYNEKEYFKWEAIR